MICDIVLGEGFGVCVFEICIDLLLCVEVQIFLVVNDLDVLDFIELVVVIEEKGGFYQVGYILIDIGLLVIFCGLIIGLSYM